MKKQYAYECQQDNGEVYTMVFNKKFPTQTIKEYLNNQEDITNKVVKCIFVKEVEQGKWHWCKYCGGIAIGQEEDLLCEECEMTFGHSRYSQL